jgi:hypothetical protein
MIPEPPKPERRGRGRVKTVLVVLGVVVALCCLGTVTAGAFVGYDLYRAPRAEAEIREFADELARHLEAGDHEAVYDALSADARHRYTLEVLARSLADRPRPVAHEIERAFGVLWLCYVTIRLSYLDGRYAGSHTFDLVKEDGAWKVDSDLLHDLDSGPRHSGHGGGGD